MSEGSDHNKQTQVQRREKTHASLLSSACRLFGERGYEATSLEDVAEDCGFTIRPIYYYFGSKRQLFAAVNALMEQRAREALFAASSVMAWEAFLALCEDQAFRRIVLEDAPNVLGRERWPASQCFPWSGVLGGDERQLESARNRQTEMCGRVARAALTEAAIAVIEADNDTIARSEAIELIARLLPGSSFPEISSSAQSNIIKS